MTLQPLPPPPIVYQLLEAWGGAMASGPVVHASWFPEWVWRVAVSASRHRDPAEASREVDQSVNSRFLGTSVARTVAYCGFYVYAPPFDLLFAGRSWPFERLMAPSVHWYVMVPPGTESSYRLRSSQAMAAVMNELLERLVGAWSLEPET